MKKYMQALAMYLIFLAVIIGFAYLFGLPWRDVLLFAVVFQVMLNAIL